MNFWTFQYNYKNLRKVPDNLKRGSDAYIYALNEIVTF